MSEYLDRTHFGTYLRDESIPNKILLLRTLELSQANMSTNFEPKRSKPHSLTNSNRIRFDFGTTKTKCFYPRVCGQFYSPWNLLSQSLGSVVSLQVQIVLKINTIFYTF